jgi:hypothetical protein
LERGDTTADFREQVSRFEFEEIFVDECHGDAGIEKDSMADK